MNFKKLLAGVLSAVMLGSGLTCSTPLASAAEKLPFTDVKEGEWYYSAVEYAYSEGFMQGGGDGKFNPSGNLTRAMFVKMLGYVCGAEPVESDIFPDVEKNSWYSGYVGWAYENGIVKGLDGGIFGGERNITRQELAVMMARYISYRETAMPRRSTAPAVFADDGDIAEWAADSVETLRRAGVTKGNSMKQFMPKSSITRAEAAQMLMNLAEAESLAWQGYVPDADADGYAVYGAKYLYTSGFGVQGGLGTELDSTGDYPVIYAFRDERADELTYESGDTFGFSPTALTVDLTKAPVVKICYSYDGAEAPESLSAFISTRTAMNTTYRSAPLTFTPSADDEGFATAICDTSSAIGAVGATFGKTSGVNVHVLFKPYEGISAEDVRFNVRYIALFPDVKSAEAFSGKSEADYLKNYFLYTDTEYTEVTEDTVDGYLAEIRDRIEEIKNSPSSVTPADIEAAGGKCYYVSSLRGNNSNDGLTPDTPLRNLDPLYYMLGPFKKTYLQAGDGVFFERGSEFYPETFHNEIVSNLGTEQYVTYGAYGDASKPKPAFYGSFDFGGGTGDWESTQWKDIYKIDLKKLLPEDKVKFAGAAGEIGSIVFNEGEYLGVRVFPNDKDDPFGEGKATAAMGKQGNGKDYFKTGGTSCKDPADALRNNLEYIHDYKDGVVYLRCEWGDPEKYFTRIDLCRQAVICYGNDNSYYDNLRFLYTGYVGLDLSDGNVVTWCEAGYCGGSSSSVGTGIGGYGECASLTIDNCYIHDVEDGPMGTQETGDYTERPEDIPELNNVVCTDNVIIAAQNMIELFSTCRIEGEDGLGRNKIRNAVITGNYAAYLGYSYPRKVDSDAEGLGLHNWYYGEMVDCIFADNTFVACEGSIMGAHIGSDGNSRGWLMYDNTYVLNPELCAILRGGDGISFTNLSKSFYSAHKLAYSERNLAYLNSIGIDCGSEYYVYDYLTDGEEFGAYFMTGWHVEHGNEPS